MSEGIDLPYDQLLPVLGRLRHRHPVRVDDGARSAEGDSRVGPHPVGRDHVDLVFDRPGADEGLPLSECREGKGRYQEDLSCSQRERATDLGEPASSRACWLVFVEELNRKMLSKRGEKFWPIIARQVLGAVGMGRGLSGSRPSIRIISRSPGSILWPRSRSPREGSGHWRGSCRGKYRPRGAARLPR